MKKTIFVSDLSGKEIEEGQSAEIRVTFADARRGMARLDVTTEEAEELAKKGTRGRRSGRRPAAPTPPSP